MLLKTLIVADMLTRSTQQQRARNRNRDPNIKHFIAVVMSNIPVSQKKMDGIGAKTTANEHLKGIFKYVENGWLNSQKPRWSFAREYFPGGNELPVHDELVFSGNRIVIPGSMRSEMLEQIQYMVFIKDLSDAE